MTFISEFKCTCDHGLEGFRWEVSGDFQISVPPSDNNMTKHQLKDEKSQESLVDGRGMRHRLG